ncbi:hypothetical protein VPNG_07839 [Cytospora leucostoma]|uniref:Uncharacterized protein n=1 Tax=Cytospora leucostoma TaxID=1230097 RepID=A0A423WGZ0_9PEZI|nr:hypothetical protein VPNG_07839 [Cytospora leucostoma]
MVSSFAQHDAELFCSTAKPQTKPERHQVPATLIPGGQTSPLRHPTVLRPGAGQVHHKHAPKSSENSRSQTPSTTPHKIPRKPLYRAYSPQSTAQDPKASLVAKEIEGFFTALDVPPLHVDKQSEPAPGRESPVQRCASPPVPPKVRLDEDASPCGEAELLQSPLSRTGTTVTEEDASSDSAPPPAYDENERAPPPPEKAQTRVHSVAREDDLPGSAVASAARVAGSVAGVRTDEALAPKTTEAATPDGETSQDSSPAEEGAEPKPKVTSDTHRGSSPPPLPPRTPSLSSLSPSPSHAPIQPDIATQHMPGENFPPPPKRSPSPPQTCGGATGAAATSATAVGAAVAMPSTDFAHGGGGLERARNALGKHVQHMVCRAREHHEQHLARKTSANGAGAGAGDGFEVYVGV